MCRSCPRMSETECMNMWAAQHASAACTAEVALSLDVSGHILYTDEKVMFQSVA